MNDNKPSDTHISIGDLASLLNVSEAEVLALEKAGTIPPPEPEDFSTNARRMYPRRKTLEMWDDWKAYCEFMDEEDGTNHANH